MRGTRSGLVAAAVAAATLVCGPSFPAAAAFASDEAGPAKGGQVQVRLRAAARLPIGVLAGRAPHAPRARGTNVPAGLDACQEDRYGIESLKGNPVAPTITFVGHIECFPPVVEVTGAATLHTASGTMLAVAACHTSFYCDARGTYGPSLLALAGNTVLLRWDFEATLAKNTVWAPGDKAPPSAARASAPRR